MLTTEVAFAVHMVPTGKGRARATTIGGHARQYTPKETVNAEAEVRAAFRAAYPSWAALDCPVVLNVRSYHPIPASMPKWKRELAEAEAWPYTGKPDWDNIGKLVADALNKIAWCDDSRVFDGRTVKLYSLQPRVEVYAEFLDEMGRAPVVVRV